MQRETYYWTNPLDYALDVYKKKTHRDKVIMPLSLVAANLEKRLKEDPIYLKLVEEQMEAKNKELYEAKVAGPNAIPDDVKKSVLQNWRKGVIDDRKENPEKYKQISIDVTNKNRENGTYAATSERMKEFRANQPLEEQQDSAKKMNDTLSATPGKRESMTANGLITKEITRNNNLKDIYEIIQETGWFTKEEVHAKYKFKGVNGKILGNQQLRNVFNDVIELGGLFESKHMNIVILTGGARRMYYTKIVEGKEIDYKSLENRVNSDNNKVRAERLLDKDHLDMRAKLKLKIEKSTAIKNEKRLKEYLAKLPKTAITQAMIIAASPNHGWHGRLKEALEVESQPLGRTGKINFRKCTWKKQ